MKMKKKYITLEEVLALRGTDTKIYSSMNGGNDEYLKFTDGILSLYKDGKIVCLNISTNSNGYYILEPEEFKVEKTGRYKTQDGRIAYVSSVGSDVVDGVIEGNDFISQWDNNGTYFDYGASNCDLVEYVGD